VTATTQGGSSPTSSQPERAADFIDALGVNIHLNQAGDGSAAVIAEMAYLGLTNVRSAGIGPKTSPSQIAAFGQLASAGLKFDWLTGGALDATVSDLDAFVSAHPGSVAAIEGPNEVNNFPITFNGLTGTAAAVAYQDALYAAVKANPLTASIPVLNFTDSPEAAGAADAVNGHPYPKDGKEPLAPLTAAYEKLARLMPGKSVYFTEAGYFTLPGMHGWEGVNAATQAKHTLNMIMDAAKLGVSATYLYDLVDDGSDPIGSIGADHFGLFTLSGQAKPSAAAIHNLTSILADPGATAGSFTTTALNYTIKGLPASGSSLLIEKSSGVYDLVIWAEPAIWNAKTNAPIAAPTDSVVVDFAAPFAQASVFDPLASDSPTRTVTDASAVTIALTDHPMIIQISNFTQAMASFAAPASAASSADAGAMGAPLTAAPTLLGAHVSRST